MIDSDQSFSATSYLFIFLFSEEENRCLSSVRHLFSVGVSEVFQGFRIPSHRARNHRVFPVRRRSGSCRTKMAVLRVGFGIAGEYEQRWIENTEREKTQ
jgi:hypothetical protein